MANVKEIQDRMKSIRDTMKITNAMYMISSSKMSSCRYGAIFLWNAGGDQPYSASCAGY